MLIFFNNLVYFFCVLIKFIWVLGKGLLLWIELVKINGILFLIYLYIILFVRMFFFIVVVILL